MSPVCFINGLRPASVLARNEVKEVAIGHLKGSSVDCPKKLRIVEPPPGLWTRAKFGSKLVVEEIFV